MNGTLLAARSVLFAKSAIRSLCKGFLFEVLRYDIRSLLD